MLKNLADAGKLLLLDLASTAFFLGLLLLSHNVTLAIVLGMGLGIVQIGWELIRRKPVDTMQWMSLFLVLGSGAATLITHDPRFVMVKASLIYVVVGIVMLKPGWMNRYLPDAARQYVPDIGVICGYVWAAMMFFSAALNLYLAMTWSLVAWSAFMSAYAIVSKAVLMVVQIITMRTIGKARRRRAEAAAAAQTAAAPA